MKRSDAPCMSPLAGQGDVDVIMRRATQVAAARAGCRTCLQQRAAGLGVHQQVLRGAARPGCAGRAGRAPLPAGSASGAGPAQRHRLDALALYYKQWAKPLRILRPWQALKPVINWSPPKPSLRLPKPLPWLPPASRWVPSLIRRLCLSKVHWNYTGNAFLSENYQPGFKAHLHNKDMHCRRHYRRVWLRFTRHRQRL